MFFFGASFVSIALLALSQLCGVASRPVSTAGREVSARSTPTGPRWVIYSDKWENKPPAASLLSGFNTFILGFYLVSGPADNVIGWTQLSAEDRASVKADYAAAGISLMVSAFGSTETPTTSGVDPVDMANKLADFVTKYDLDGVDIDYEDFGAWNSADGRSETWLIALTKQLRKKLPAGQYLISHAPIGAWFPSALWSGGGYEAIDKAVGSMIDWYNVQWYSQAADQYVSCAGLLDKATQFPGSALFEISAAGVPQDKLVIGKPATAADASDFITADVLAPCLKEAKNKGWNGGAMLWEYPDAGSEFITAARALSWPVSGDAPPPPASSSAPPASSHTSPASSHTSPASSHTSSASSSIPSLSISNIAPPASSSVVVTPPFISTTTSAAGSNPTSGGSCTSASAWDKSTTYTGGTSVTYNGHLWTAKWWNVGDAPTASADHWSDIWVDKAAC